MQTEPGDLILVKSKKVVFAFFRWLAGSPYDHVAVVIEEDKTINIDKPMTGCLMVQRLLQSELEPLVLRPRFNDEQQRASFVRWIASLSSCRYDTRRTLQLLCRLLFRRIFRWAPAMEPPSPKQGERICTDAVLLGLETYMTGFREIQSLPLDWVRLHCGTTNDFLKIANLRRDLLLTIH